MKKIEVFVTYNDESQIKRIGDANLVSPIFHFINTQSKSGQKEAYALKSHWAARLDPFVLILEDGKAVKAFYSETGENVIDSLLNYLKDEITNR